MTEEKWHIFDGNHCTLRWCDRTAEFDSYESAERFLRSFVEGQNMIFKDYCKICGIYYKKSKIILDPDDTVPINLTNKIVKFKGHSEDCVLTSVKES